MYCRRCHYPLANLTEHRCPECGGKFDPGDVSSSLRTLTPEWTVASKAALLVNAFAGLITLAMFFVSTEFGSFADVLVAIADLSLFIAWTISPYVLLATLAWAFRQRVGASVIILIGSLGIAVFAISMIVNAMFINLNPQSGIIFAVLPPLQVVGGLGVGLVALMWIVAGRLIGAPVRGS